MKHFYKGYVINIQPSGQCSVYGFASTFAGQQAAQDFIDGLLTPSTSICPKCQGRGWYFVQEFFGTLQGRKDCHCINKN
jgi:hypothetical protein